MTSDARDQSPEPRDPVESLPTWRAARVAAMGAKDTRRVLGFIMATWAFGAPFFAVTTGAPLTSFLQNYLHTSDFVYGLLMSVGPAAVLFQLLGSYIVERTGRVKRLFLVNMTIHRLLWLLVAALPLVLPVVPGAGTGVQVAIVGGVMFVSQILNNVGSAGWAAWMTTIVPGRLAGRFLGTRAQLGLATMLVGGLVAVVLLDRFAGVGWMYAAAFGVAALLGTTDILLFTPVPEFPRAPEPRRPSFPELLATPWRERLFRTFAAYVAVAWVSYTMLNAFVWRFCFDSVAQHGMGMNLLTATLIVATLPQLGMALFSGFWGRVLDRLGPRPVLAFSALTHVIFVAVWVFMRPGLFWLLPIAGFLGGLTWPGNDQVLLYMQVKGFPEERRTAYNAMFQVVFGLAGVAGGVLGGVLASAFALLFTHITWLPAGVSHYHPVFLVVLLLRLSALLFIFPRLPLAGVGGHRDVLRALVGGMKRSS
jgi:MFS family permease